MDNAEEILRDIEEFFRGNLSRETLCSKYGIRPQDLNDFIASHEPGSG